MGRVLLGFSGLWMSILPERAGVLGTRPITNQNYLCALCTETGTRSAVEKWATGRSNKAFLHFLLNFSHIWWFFKAERTEVAAKLWKIIKNLARTKENSFATLTLKPHFSTDSGYPFPPLDSTLKKITC